jgi:hypothetical protein
MLLLAALALLCWLAIFAGEVRQEGAVKQQWAVLTSRLLALAGGFVLVRLFLFAYEERVPVILLDLGRLPHDTDDIETYLRYIRDLCRGGYETIPLSDVVMFIRERRYVPKKCFALVVEVSSLEQLGSVLGSTEDLNPTYLLPSGILDECVEDASAFKLSQDVGLGITFEEAQGGLPREIADLERTLRSFAEESSRLLGRRPEYARVAISPSVDAQALVSTAGYECLFDGKGYNRFGDESYLVRVMDVSALIMQRVAVRARVATYLALFRGKYIHWPVEAVTGITCRSARKS